jgi:hypothetical protein
MIDNINAKVFVLQGKACAASSLSPLLNRRIVIFPDNFSLVSIVLHKTF